MQRHSIAVLIPVRDEAALIQRCLAAVLGGTLEPDEVLVLDGGSSDGTRDRVLALADHDPRIRLLDNPARHIPAALNLGWRSTTCEVIVRVDGHAVISDRYLELAHGHLTSGAWQGVGGRKVPEAATATGRAIAAAMGSRLGVGNSRYHYATSIERAEHVPFGAYLRSTIEELGGWDEELLVNQDFEFDYRLRKQGGSICFDPAMSSRWSCSATFRDLAHQYHRYGRGKARVAVKHPRSLSLRQVLPPLLPVGLGSLTVLAVVGGPPWAGLARAALVLYGTFMVAALFPKAARRLPWSERLRFPLVIFIMHHAWGIGFLRGLISRLVGRRPKDQFRTRDLGLPSPETNAAH